MRYLSDKESFRTVKILREMYKYADDQDNNKIDLKLIPYLKRLNRLVGVATVKSCAGHNDDGYLLLKLSNSMSNVFCEKVFNLVKTGGVSRVCLWYAPDGCELIEVWFSSLELESGKQIVNRITLFFELLKCY